MSRPPSMVGELVRAQAKGLKMPGLARSFESLARQAREEHWSHEEFLHEVLSAEASSRRESAVRQRLREARFPELKTLEEFDFELAEGVDAAQIATLASGEWLARAANVILAGPIGTGKTHLAIALGVEACKKLKHVLFWRAADLVRALLEARDGRELGRLQRRLARFQLIVLDEVGFVPFERAGGELLFNLVAERYERRSLLVTTNLAFSEWPKVLGGDEKLTTALLDRLGDRATVITTQGKSFRMRRRQHGERVAKAR
jgi:DNA replication protein DnaC